MTRTLDRAPNCECSFGGGLRLVEAASRQLNLSANEEGRRECLALAQTDGVEPSNGEIDVGDRFRPSADALEISAQLDQDSRAHIRPIIGRLELGGDDTTV